MYECHEDCILIANNIRGANINLNKTCRHRKRIGAKIYGFTNLLDLYGYFIFVKLFY